MHSFYAIYYALVSLCIGLYHSVVLRSLRLIYGPGQLVVQLILGFSKKRTLYVFFMIYTVCTSIFLWNLRFSKYKKEDEMSHMWFDIIKKRSIFWSSLIIRIQQGGGTFLRSSLFRLKRTWSSINFYNWFFLNFNLKCSHIIQLSIKKVFDRLRSFRLTLIKREHFRYFRKGKNA